jgi:5-methylcytosine-specific restriction endonuclease McrA
MRTTDPEVLDAWRDCPRCGGRPRLVTDYVQTRRHVRKDGTTAPPAGRVQAWCSDCGRPYSPGHVPIRDLTPDQRLARYLANWLRWDARLTDKARADLTGERWGGKYAAEISFCIRHRDGHTCQLCGAPADQVDHVIDRSAGGALFDPDNLRACCRPCNRARQRNDTARPRDPLTGQFLVSAQ